ncbi:hypothetical protein C9374_003211 [Naegleria lovaniensis]|uniref:Uncharacterized protein n=1 Tax=Naegleria lovaniensis TaxID=51637 RepID=A0AA88GNS9_NAELO|nr:uncharacterized protein C9374_003211 [Naegleria lovaniensis]KAG2386062.1 hypothetical protein C9374_003211 [Naegleria lovaniensis]
MHQQPTEKHLDKRKVLDLYFTLNSERLIERQELERYLSSRAGSKLKDSEEDLENTELAVDNKKEVFTMFLAMKAYYEQQMGLEGAEETFKKAHEALSKMFNKHSNFYVACTYAFMAGYESACGRLKMAKFYLHFLNFYFDEMSDEEKQNLSIYQKNLKKHQQFITLGCKNDSSIMTLIRDWLEVYETFLGISFPTEWKTFVTQHLNIHNYLLIIKIIESMEQLGRIHVSKSGDGTMLTIFNDAATFVVNGIKIGILSAVGCGRDMIEESAFKITQGTESNFFNLLPPFIVPHLVAATKVHMHIVKSIERGERNMTSSPNNGNSTLTSIDYYDILSKDLRGLRLLGKRFKKVVLQNKKLLDEVEEILQRKQLFATLRLATQTFADQSTQLLQHHHQPLVADNSIQSGAVQASTNYNNLENHFASQHHMDFSALGNMASAKDFFKFISNQAQQLNFHSTPQEQQPQNMTTTSYQDLLNGIFQSSSTTPISNVNGFNMHENQTNDSFEPFLDLEDIQQLYGTTYNDNDNLPDYSSFLNNN